jgi:hypothetical protein
MSRPALNVEQVATELMADYEIRLPAVPLEAILQDPRPTMWRAVNLHDLRPGFHAIQVPFGTRMVLAQLLARLLIDSAWGEQRGLAPMRGQPTAVHALGRAILMPRVMLMRLPAEALQPPMVSRLYEAPLSEAADRLAELGVNELPQSA